MAIPRIEPLIFWLQLPNAALTVLCVVAWAADEAGKRVGARVGRCI